MLSHLNIFISLALSFTIVYFVIPKIIKVSKIIKLYDVPNQRSAAKQIVPTLGGIAIFAGFIISTIVSSNGFSINELKYMFVGVTVMFLIGLKDDIIGMSAKKKLISQIVIALYLIIIGNYRITNLHGILGIQEIGYVIGLLISMVAIVGIINAFNLIDGIDGLASGIGILVSITFGVLFMNVGDSIYSITCFSLTGSLVAFYLYNVFGHTNKIFMGDTGSLILGVVVAILIIHFVEFTPASMNAVQGSVAIAFSLIIVPVIDTIRVFAIRISQKRSPFSPDMNHIHHNLLKLTGNHLATSTIIIAVNGVIIWFTFLLVEQIEEPILFLILLVAGFILAGVPAVLVKRLPKEVVLTKLEKKSIFALSIFTKKLKE